MAKSQTVSIPENGFSLIELLVSILIMSIIIIALYDLFDTNTKIYRAQEQVTTMNQRTRTAMEQMVSAIRMADSNSFAINLGGKPGIAQADLNTIRVVEDLPYDANGDGNTFDRNDLNGDGDYNDDNEDNNADGYINDPDEDVTFSLSGTNLIKTQYIDTTYCPNVNPGCTLCPSSCPPATQQVLATNINSLTFQYYSTTNANPATEVTPPITGANRFNIKVIRVTLDAQTASKDRTTNSAHSLRLKSDIFLRNN